MVIWKNGLPDLILTGVELSLPTADCKKHTNTMFQNQDLCGLGHPGPQSNDQPYKCIICDSCSGHSSKEVGKAEPFMSVVRTWGHVVLRLLVQVVTMTLLPAGGQHK